MVRHSNFSSPQPSLVSRNIEGSRSVNLGQFKICRLMRDERWCNPPKDFRFLQLSTYIPRSDCSCEIISAGRDSKLGQLYITRFTSEGRLCKQDGSDPSTWPHDLISNSSIDGGRVSFLVGGSSGQFCISNVRREAKSRNLSTGTNASFEQFITVISLIPCKLCACRHSSRLLKFLHRMMCNLLREEGRLVTSVRKWQFERLSSLKQQRVPACNQEGVWMPV